MSRSANISLIAEREIYLILFVGKCSKYYAASHPHERLEDNIKFYLRLILFQLSEMADYRYVSYCIWNFTCCVVMNITEICNFSSSDTAEVPL